MKTPESIKSHSLDYVKNSWQDYTLQELGMWVHLLLKRSKHRTVKENAIKDVDDAQNYLNMLQAHIDEARETLK